MRRSPNQPAIIDLGRGDWMVECHACRTDHLAEVSIGIGMPLPDRRTAERLGGNHARTHEAREPSQADSLGHTTPRPLAVARRR
jgi:hypothetical protein